MKSEKTEINEKIPDQGSARQPKVVKKLQADDLFDGAREIRLYYHSEEYRLRITKNQKLILTK